MGGDEPLVPNPDAIPEYKEDPQPKFLLVEKGSKISKPAIKSSYQLRSKKENAANLGSLEGGLAFDQDDPVSVRNNLRYPRPRLGLKRRLGRGSSK